jgi:hypothetical protein
MTEASQAAKGWKFADVIHNVRLFCEHHQNFLEWFADDETEAEHPFETALWYCQGLSRDHTRIVHQQDAIDTQVGKAQAMPGYPPGGYKKINMEYWPTTARSSFDALEKELEKAREDCRESWQIVIEESHA